MNYDQAINCPHWWDLKDACKARSKNRCEYCGRNRRIFGYELHHRHYLTVGIESLADVLLVCVPCHEIIHGLRQPPRAWPVFSLAARGDSGMGPPPGSALWLAYLADQESFLETPPLWLRHGFSSEEAMQRSDRIVEEAFGKR